MRAARGIDPRAARCRFDTMRIFKEKKGRA